MSHIHQWRRLEVMRAVTIGKTNRKAPRLTNRKARRVTNRKEPRVTNQPKNQRVRNVGF